MKNMKKFLAVVLALVMMIGAVSTASAANFTDVADDHKYVAAIEQLNALKLIEGNGDGTFSPDKTITRAEAVKMIYVYVLGTNKNGSVKDVTLFTGDSVFGDVVPGDWYCGYVNWAAAYGIVNGVGQDLFNPNADVKLSELVKMIWGAAQVLAGTNLNAVEAKNLPSYPYGYIAKAEELGVFEGLEIAGVSSAATKGEAAQMLANLLADEATLDRFAHVKAVKGTYQGWTNGNFTADVNTADKTQMVIEGATYETTVDLTDLVYGAEIIAYQDTNNNKIILVSDNTVDSVATTVAGITKSNNKYYADGAQFTLASTVEVYEQGANGLYTLSTKTVDDLVAVVDDAVVTLVKNEGKVNVVLVNYMGHFAKLSGYNSLLGTVNLNGSAVKAANIKGVDATVATTAEYNVTVERVKGATIYTLAEMNKKADVKVTKLDKLSGDHYTEVYSDADLYKYATDLVTADKIEKLSTAEGTQVKNTVNLWLDNNGNIIKWETVAAPGSTGATTVTGYAYVAGLTVEEVVGTWATELVYNVTVNNVDGTSAAYKLEKAALAANANWYDATNDKKGNVVTKVVNNVEVPAINGAFVKYTASNGTVTAITAEDPTTWATVELEYNKAYTGLIKLDGEYKAISTIKAVVYDGKIVTVDEFIASCGDAKTLTAVPAVDYANGKLIVVGKFTTTPAAPTTSEAYAIITGAYVSAGSTNGTFKYTVTGTFNGVAGTYESVDFDSNTAGLSFTMNKLSVVKFENGKINATATVDASAFTNYVFTAVNGALYTFREATDIVNNTVASEVKYFDLQTNVKEIIVYKTTTKDKGMSGDLANLTKVTFADFAALLSTVEGTACAANPFAYNEVVDAQGKKTITIVILAADAATCTVQ